MLGPNAISGGISIRRTIPYFTSISANADRPRDAASRKLDHIALPIEFSLITRQQASVDKLEFHGTDTDTDFRDEPIV